MNLELCSLIFSVKIYVFWISHDLYLQTLIINTRSNNTIELFRNGNFYDVLFSVQKTENIGVCQEILFDVISYKNKF